MINFWYELTNDEFGFHHVAIMANSDFVDYLKDFNTEREAEIAGEAFIRGIKFVRGEQ
jgi:hypothetical protein